MRRKREPSGTIGGADITPNYEDEQFEHSSAAIGALGAVMVLLLICMVQIEGFDRAHASRHAAVDTLRAAENQLLREEVEQLRTVRRGAPGGSSSSSPLARSAGAKERHAARAEREQRRRDEQQSALDQSLKGFSRPGEVSI